MKFIRPVDLYDISRAISLYDQLEIDIKVVDQAIFDMHQGIRSALRKEARNIAKLLIEEIDKNFMSLIDSMTGTQTLSTSFYNFDKDTESKRRKLGELEDRYSRLLQDDNHKENARKLAAVLKESEEIEKTLSRYDFDAFKRFVLFAQQYGYHEPTDLWQKVQCSLSGVTAQRRHLVNTIVSFLGHDQDPKSHVEHYLNMKRRLEELYGEADKIRDDVAKINTMRIQISSISDSLSDSKELLHEQISKQLEAEIPKLDLPTLLKRCKRELKNSFSIYYVALNQLTILDILMRFNYSQALLVESERSVLQIIESRMNNREIVGLTRATREAMLMFVVRRPLVIKLDVLVRLKLISNIASSVQKCGTGSAMADALAVSPLALLSKHASAYLPSGLLFLLFHGVLRESDIEYLKGLPEGDITLIDQYFLDVVSTYDDEWLSIAGSSQEMLVHLARGGLGSAYNLTDFKRQISKIGGEQQYSSWYSAAVGASPAHVKSCLDI